MRHSCGLELGKRRLEFPAKEKKLIRSGLPELWLRRPSVSVIWKKQGTGAERSRMHLCVGHHLPERFHQTNLFQYDTNSVDAAHLREDPACFEHATKDLTLTSYQDAPPMVALC